jgi:hypothetical protein
MSDPKEPPTVDIDNVPETLCLGRFNLSISPPLATLTFTHLRPRIGPLVASGAIEPECVVRARIVVSLDNLVALRDLLNKVFQEKEAGAATHGGGASTQH